MKLSYQITGTLLSNSLRRALASRATAQLLADGQSRTIRKPEPGRAMSRSPGRKRKRHGDEE